MTTLPLERPSAGSLDVTVDELEGVQVLDGLGYLQEDLFGRQGGVVGGDIENLWARPIHTS